MSVGRVDLGVVIVISIIKTVIIRIRARRRCIGRTVIVGVPTFEGIVVVIIIRIGIGIIGCSIAIGIRRIYPSTVCVIGIIHTVIIAIGAAWRRITRSGLSFDIIYNAVVIGINVKVIFVTRSVGIGNGVINIGRRGIISFQIVIQTVVTHRVIGHTIMVGIVGAVAGFYDIINTVVVGIQIQVIGNTVGIKITTSSTTS